MIVLSGSLEGSSSARNCEKNWVENEVRKVGLKSCENVLFYWYFCQQLSGLQIGQSFRTRIRWIAEGIALSRWYIFWKESACPQEQVCVVSKVASNFDSPASSRTSLKLDVFNWPKLGRVNSGYVYKSIYFICHKYNCKLFPGLTDCVFCRTVNITYSSFPISSDDLQ